MRLSPRFTVIIAIPIGFLFAATLLLNFNQTLQWKKTRYASMENIARGIRDFNFINHRLPTNLTEVVDSGNLPAVATFYSCPIRQGRLFWLPRKSYSDNDFEMVFTTNEVLVMMDRKIEEKFLGKFPQLGTNQVRLLIQEGESNAMSPR